MRRLLLILYVLSYSATLGAQDIAVDRPKNELQGPATRIVGESRPWIYPASRIALYGGFTADLVTTLKCDRFSREENPILGQSPARQLLISGGLTVAFDLLSHSLHAEHPKAAAIMNFVAGGAHVGAAGWNVHVMGTYR